jgi:hypothetical protein
MLRKVGYNFILKTPPPISQQGGNKKAPQQGSFLVFTGQSVNRPAAR